METLQFHITKVDSVFGMDLSNFITDDINTHTHTHNNGGLMTVCGLNMFMYVFYDFTSFLRVSLIFINIQMR